MTKKSRLILISAILLIFGVGSVSAQSASPYSVGLRRDFGYGNGGNIQGNMTLTLSGDETQVSQVTYLMDDTILVSLNTPPFSFSFNTDKYPQGMHILSAKVKNQDGQIFQTEGLNRNFLTSEQAGQGTRDLLIPILAIVVISLLISTLGQSLFNRKPGEHKPGDYGAFGGTVCPKCGNPFSRSFFGVNLVAGRLERCPYCGKWSFTHRADLSELAAAEARMTEEYKAAEPVKSEAEKTKDLLDETRYTDK